MSLEKLQRCHRCPSIVVGVLSFEKERKNVTTCPKHVHWVTLSTGLWLKVFITMPRLPSYDSGTLLSETDPECALATFPDCDELVASDKKCLPRKYKDSGIPGDPYKWNRYLARDPPSYDSGTLLSEADVKTIMDKMEARSKWLKANGKRQQFGKHQRVILARAKFKADDDNGIPRQQAHEVSTHTVRNWYRYLARDNNPKAFHAIYLFPLHGESETDLCNIWAAMRRTAYKTCPSSHDYSKLKAVFQQFKDANTNWKDILLAYRAEKIRDWNRHWHAIRRVMTVEHSYRGLNTLIEACTSGTLRSRPVPKDIGYAKTLMDKIEVRTKWLKANGRARQLEKHQRVIQQHKHASEDSHTSRLMRR